MERAVAELRQQGIQQVDILVGMLTVRVMRVIVDRAIDSVHGRLRLLAVQAVVQMHSRKPRQQHGEND